MPPQSSARTTSRHHHRLQNFWCKPLGSRLTRGRALSGVEIHSRSSNGGHHGRTATSRHSCTKHNQCRHGHCLGLRVRTMSLVAAKPEQHEDVRAVVQRNTTCELETCSNRLRIENLHMSAPVLGTHRPPTRSKNTSMSNHTTDCVSIAVVADIAGNALVRRRVENKGQLGQSLRRRMALRHRFTSGAFVPVEPCICLVLRIFLACEATHHLEPHKSRWEGPIHTCFTLVAEKRAPSHEVGIK